MIFSAQQLFSDNQAIIADAPSTNIIDLSAAGTPYGAVRALNDDIGKGNKVSILIQVTETFNNADDITFIITTSVDGGSFTNNVISETVVLADLVAGKQFVLECLPNEITDQFIRIQYIVNGASAPNTGRITAGITMGNQTNTVGA